MNYSLCGKILPKKKWSVQQLSLLELYTKKAEIKEKIQQMEVGKCLEIK